ncbi:MAG: ATP-binding cassette domain-containing protein [Bauldia sp.]|nr:ATP-binding cassette domain-containing protein [Bauldia sp.]
MESHSVIRAERLGKRYVIGHEVNREGYRSFREVLSRAARNVTRRSFDLVRGRAIVAGDQTEDYWALRNVDFDVMEGEVVGILGRNGAGKSTLLKILSRITDPSEGTVRINGRVSSLLEVGTGFHPELSGRENIYLNGAILGMTRREIRSKFDAIVDFSGVETFLDTPVKRYSSGMSVRLAFAVAAHLEPEILIVDEVLAVGDAEFQRKCIGKMGEVARGGRTVLFVSHNMTALRALCDRGIVLKAGSVRFDGTIDDAIALHLADTDGGFGTVSEWTWAPGREPHGTGLAISRVALTGSKSKGPAFRSDEAITVTIEYEQTAQIRGLRMICQIVTGNGDVAFSSTDQLVRTASSQRPGRYRTQCLIPPDILNWTPYLVRVACGIPGQHTVVPLTDVGRFHVHGPTNATAPLGGAVAPRTEWRIEALDGQGAGARTAVTLEG